MRKIAQSIIVILLSVCAFLPAVQAQSFKSNLELADAAFEGKNYYTAAKYYLKVFDEIEEPEEVAYPYGAPTTLKKNEDFDVYQYVMVQLAESYYNYHDYLEAEKWYAKVSALQEFKNVNSIVNYGITLRANEHYDEALVIMQKAKSKHQAKYVRADNGKMVEAEDTKALSERIDFEIKCCEFAIEQVKNEPGFKPEKLDSIKLNKDAASNYAAELMKDYTIMFTTTRYVNKNPTSRKKGAYRNSLMTYHLLDSIMRKIEFGFGLDRNAASPSMSKDGEFLFITSWSNETDLPRYEIMVSRPLNDSIWEEPKKLNELVNLRGTNAKTPYVTNDGKGLYFASDRGESFGGYDIYFIRLDENGQPYGRAMNLGKNVNTVRDEESPFFDEDEKTLYFSSNGRIGMGGFDIYASEKVQADWSPAANLGYPLNSSKDESYYMASDEENVGFLSSDRGNTCCYQLYSFETNYYYVGGKVLDAVDDSFLEGVRVTLLDSLGETELASTYTDEMGEYAFVMNKGRDYQVVYQRENFLDDEQGFNSSEAIANDTMPLPTIKLITTEIGRAVNLENIYYDFGKATLRPESIGVINKLCTQIAKYPYLVIEIGSHTDNIGSDSYNQKLSQRRSQSVVDQMISQGIPTKMIRAKGYGEIMPKVPNTNPDGSDNEENRQINRRTEFKVLEYNFDEMNKK